MGLARGKAMVEGMRLDMEEASATTVGEGVGIPEVATGRAASASGFLGGRWAYWRVAGAFCVAAAILWFLVWPYQTGHLEERISFLHGLYALVTSPGHGEWLYCLAVLPLTGWLVYRERDRLAQLAESPSWWGWLAFLLAAGFYWVGYKANTRFPAYLSVQFFVAGVVLWLGGWRWMRALWLPWLFLFFAWPMVRLENIISFPLRIITAKVTQIFLNLVGEGTLLEGTALVSAADPGLGIGRGEKFSLDVEKDCSGLRSLFSLVMITALYAIIALRHHWQRVVLLMASLPLAMAGNFVRMLLLVYGTIFFGEEFAIGERTGDHQKISTYHFLTGLAVFGVALGGMFLLAGILEKRKGKKKGKGKGKAGAGLAEVRHEGMEALRAGVTRGLPVFGFGVLVLFGCWATPVGQVLSPAGMRMWLPDRVGEYVGEVQGMSAKEETVFEPGVEVARSFYRAPGQHGILATLVMSGPITRSLHEPDVCLPGQGWQILGSELVDVTLADGRVIQASVRFLQAEASGPGGREITRAVNLFWYQGMDVASASYDGHVLLGYRDSVFRNVDHRWGMCSFFIQMVGSGEGAMFGLMEELVMQEQLKQFVSQIGPEILLLPEELGDASLASPQGG
jgi:exosortase